MLANPCTQVRQIMYFVFKVTTFKIYSSDLLNDEKREFLIGMREINYSNVSIWFSFINRNLDHGRAILDLKIGFISTQIFNLFLISIHTPEQIDCVSCQSPCMRILLE